MSFSIHGLAVSRGIAIGRAVLVASSRADVAHYFIEPDHVESEVRRIRVARDAVADEIARVQRDLPKDAPPELAALLDAAAGRATVGWRQALDRGAALQRRMGHHHAI
jgi:phosphotransferase system enzyme I (PtsI)